MTIDAIFKSFHQQKIAILGLGREGWSSYRLIRHYLPHQELTLLDKNPHPDFHLIENDNKTKMILGEDYLNDLNQFDIILKSPGVNIHHLDYFLPKEKLTSQIDIFLKVYAHQVIGITGTKGKSTTSSLIAHILGKTEKHTILAGNIGIPVFDIIDQIRKDTWIVCELSAHQLEHIHRAPHIAVLLNFFQEHLDYFTSYSAYKEAKFNITKYQTKDDYFIYNSDNQELYTTIEQFGIKRHFSSFSHTARPMDKMFDVNDNIYIRTENGTDLFLKCDDRISIKGLHNQLNIMAAFLVCQNLDIVQNVFITHLQTFKGLEHRLEKVGIFKDILFYNDSISTIPEAAIMAIDTLKNVDTLILGGHDRDIDYTPIVNYLIKHPIRNIAFTGKAGEHIYNMLLSKNAEPENFIITPDYDEIVSFAFNKTAKHKICLLSPAASSYDHFKNFEVRGKTYKELIIKYGTAL